MLINKSDASCESQTPGEREGGGMKALQPKVRLVNYMRLVVLKGTGRPKLKQEA